MEQTMKRFLLLTTALLVLMLIVTLTPANPIQLIILSELLFDKDGGWEMEIANSSFTTNLDGWYLKSKTDSASFKDGFRHSTPGYFAFSDDSLKKPLAVNPLGDSICLFSPQGWRDLIIFGPAKSCAISAPRYGQSICKSTYGWYLDNSPTLGAQNDATNATGITRFLIHDSLEHPIKSAWIQYDFSSMWPMYYYADSNGIASLSTIAARMSFQITATGYTSQWIRSAVYPESTITVPVTLARAPDAVKNLGISGPGSFAIDNPYPNPFNPQVMVEYTLPRNGTVEIQVYDIAGKLVSEIFSGRQSEGKHVARWEAAAYPSGVYLIRVKTTDGIAMKKCLLLK
jgi:hypothetical protein